MRLICPNCDAQYEVDAAMIPAAGRDVQCSNCGKTWFQAPEGAVAAPETAPEPAPETEVRSGDGLSDEARSFFEREPEPEDTPEPAETAPEPEEPAAEAEATSTPDPDEDWDSVAEDAAPEPEQETEPAATAPDRLDDEEDEDEEDGPPPDVPPPPRRELDPAVLGILKAEAERELAARKAEAESMESQPDLGLAEPAPAPPSEDDEVAARTARLRGDDDSPEAATGRKTVLPDIDEINSTLTATSDRKAAQAPQEVDMTQVLKRRAGFRFGFSFVMLLTAALILVYLYAPQISSAVPPAEPVLSGYVDWANGMRLSIDGFLERSVDSLTALLIDLSS